MNHEMPVFVKIEEYKDVLEVIGLIKNKIAQAKDILSKIDELKNQEESELDSWKTNLDDIEKKVDDIDSSLAEPSIH